jgi:phage recombination protein Bet
MNAIIRSNVYDNDQIALIKSKIAVDATNDELKLFLYQCERTGLDPFARQIYSIKRSGKHQTQVSIDGARLIAQRTGRYGGQDGPWWCGEDGVWTDVWLKKENPAAARVVVFLLGVDRPTPGVALWREYKPDSSPMWNKMPALMLAKCAEMLALRKAFPQELSGLYAAEEMAQADTHSVIEVVPSRKVDVVTGEIASLPSPNRQPADYDVDGDVVFAQAPKTVQRMEQPDYVTAWQNMTGKMYDAVNWIQALHRNSSAGRCSEKQYGFVVNVIDKLTDDKHREVLSILCQSPISSDNVPSKEAASAILKHLPKTLRVEQTDADGKMTKVTEPNPEYKPEFAAVVTAMSKLNQPELALA